MDRIAFDRELAKLDDHAEAGYLLALHVRHTSPMMFFQTFDPDWVRYHSENGFMLRDPLMAWSFATKGVTRWSNPRIPDPYGIFQEARRFGLHYGLTVSTGPVTSRTVASIARSDREFDDDEIVGLETLVSRLHAMCDPGPSLTAAQVEALRCIAAGDRQAQAAERLGISESALKLRLAGARDRLMARTTAEAIQRATDHHLI